MPPNIFEDIQHKGRDLGWPIPAQFLKPCLPCRDALNWVNVNLLHGHYEAEDLVKVAESKFPLKELSIRTYRITSKLYDIIKRVSWQLEVLHVGFRDSDDDKMLVDILLFILLIDYFNNVNKITKHYQFDVLCVYIKSYELWLNVY